MSWLHRLRNSFSRSKSADIDEELAFHLEERRREAIAAGMNEDEAGRAARLRFGSPQHHRESTRDQDVLLWFDSLRRDLLLALRALSRRRGLAATIVLSLGVGMGATAAMFSIADALLWQPFPFADPDRVVAIQEIRNGQPLGANPARFRDLREQVPGFSALAGIYGEGMVLTGRGDARRMDVLRTLGPLLALTGVQPMLGRGFTPREEDSAAPVALLTAAAWRKHFGGDASILNQALILDGKPYTIIGVLPESMTFPESDEAWVPVAPASTNRKARWFEMFARLKPGETRASLEAQLATVAARLAAQYPDSDSGITIRIREVASVTVGDSRTPVLLLLGTVAFVLLLACTNTAGLLLARAAEREHETGIRLALGAGARSLMQTAIVESLLLALCGGALGLALASLSAGALRNLLPQGLPRADAIAINLRVIAFGFLLALVCGLASAIFPAWQTARFRLTHLRSGGRATAGRDRMRARTAFVFGQIGLAAMVLIGAALFGRGFLKLIERPTGVRADGVLTMRTSFSWDTQPPKLHGFIAQTLDRMRQIPGVSHAAVTDRLPANGGSQSGSLAVRGRTFDPRTAPDDIGRRAVSEDYFAVMGIPLRRGRVFRDQLPKGAPGEAVLNETLARRLFPNGEDPLGQWISFNPDRPGTWRQVTGIVADAQRSPREPAPPAEVYVSYSTTYWAIPTFVTRTSAPARTVMEGMRAAVRETDPNVPLESVVPLETGIAATHRQPRLLALLMAGFGLTSLALACIGLYGLLASDVAARRQELGVRLALGATPAGVLWLTIRRGMGLTLAGLAAGLLASIPLSRWIASVVPGLVSLDPLVYLTAAASLLAIALLATYLPARRAALVDPVSALRRD